MTTVDETLSSSADYWLFCRECDHPVMVDFSVGCFWHFDPWMVNGKNVRKGPCMTVIGVCSLVDDAGYAKDPQLPYLDARYTASTGCIYMDSVPFGSPPDQGWNRYEMIYCFRNRNETYSHIIKRCDTYLDFVSEFRLIKHDERLKDCSPRVLHNCGFKLFVYNQVAGDLDRNHMGHRFSQWVEETPYAIESWSMKTTCSARGVADLDNFQSRIICGVLEDDCPQWPCTKFSNDVNLPQITRYCSCNFNQSQAYLTNVRELSDLLYLRRWSVLQCDVSKRTGRFCPDRKETWCDTFCCNGKSDRLCKRKFCVEEVACLPFSLLQWGCCYYHCPVSGWSSSVMNCKSADFAQREEFVIV